MKLAIRSDRFGLAGVAVLAVTLAALALRLWHLQFQSLWWDEGVSIYLSGLDLRALTVAKDFSVDLHPPGYHLALAGWRVILGPSVFSDRLFSVFCGILTVPLTYQLVRLIDRFDLRLTAVLSADGWHTTSFKPPGPAAPALVAALLVAISPIDVYYSQETRMYALLPALGLISLIATARLLHAEGRGAWIVWIMVTAAGLYSYYYLGLLTAAEALVLLGDAVRGARIRRWILAQVAALLLYAPWAALMVGRLGGGALALPASTAVHLTPITYLLENWQDFTVGFTMPPAAPFLMIAFAVAALVGAVEVGRRRPSFCALLLLSAIIPFAGAGAVLLARPFFYPRFILFAAIPIWVLTAVGLTAHRRLWPLATIVLLAILVGNGWTWYQERITPRVGYAPDDYRTVFTTLQARARPGDVVLAGYPWQAGYVEAYLWNRGVRAAFLPGHGDPRLIDAAAGPPGRLWVYEYSPDHRFEGNWLEQTLTPRKSTLEVDQYGDSRIILFAPRATGASHAPPVQATFGAGIALESAEVNASGPARPGDTIRVTLRWRALATPAQSYTVFLHLLGPDGKVAAQHDGPPVDGAFPTDRWSVGEELVDRYALTIPAGAPAGRYPIELGMYEPSTGKRLTVGPVPQQDNRIVIGDVTVGD